jgi:hypothetical protein
MHHPVANFLLIVATSDLMDARGSAIECVRRAMRASVGSGVDDSSSQGLLVAAAAGPSDCRSQVWLAATKRNGSRACTVQADVTSLANS